jgi:hypothetical protein
LQEQTARAHHERLAAALVAREERVEPELLLHHLEHAGQPTRAATYADQAALRAADAFAFMRAAELWRIAIRLGTYDDAELRRLHRRLADALMHAGHGAVAAEQYLLAAQGADPTLNLECRAFAARAFVSTGHLGRGVATMEAVLDDLGIELPRSPYMAAASILWQGAKLALRGRGWQVRREHEIPKHDLVIADAMRAVSEGLGPIDPVRANVLHKRHLLMALRLGEPKRVTRALGKDASYMASQGLRQLARARRLVEDTKRYAATLGTEDDYSLGGNMEGVLSFFAGELEGAARHFEAADERWREAEVYDPAEVNTIRLFWIGTLRDLGAFARWRQLLPVFLRESEQRGNLLAMTSITRVSVLVRLSDDDPDRAHADLASTSWPTPPGQFHMQDWYELQARLEIALYERTVVDISEWAQKQLERLRKSLLYYARPLRYVVNGLWARMYLALAADRRKREHALRQASRLANKMRKDRAPHVDVWALLIDAAVAARRGDEENAVRLLEQAEADGDKLDLGLCTAGARWRRAALIGGDRGEELRAQAVAWQQREGVVDLQRLVEVMVPGFD